MKRKHLQDTVIYKLIDQDVANSQIGPIRLSLFLGHVWIAFGILCHTMIERHC